MGVTQPYVRPLIRVMANEFLNSLGWDFRMVAVRTIHMGVLPSADAPATIFSSFYQRAEQFVGGQLSQRLLHDCLRVQRIPGSDRSW